MHVLRERFGRNSRGRNTAKLEPTRTPSPEQSSNLQADAKWQRIGRYVSSDSLR